MCSDSSSSSSRDDQEVELSSIAPMERKEQEALYYSIQGFVGKWWNGSDLYPDPCGWTPIQGVYCDLYDGLWYVSAINIGPVYENSLRCSPKPEFSHHLFKLKHLKSLSFFSCFMISPLRISSLRWEKFSNSLESLEFRSNPSLVGTMPTAIGYLRKLNSLVLLENGLSGKLPMEMGNLVKLRKLVLQANHFAGQIPTSFGQLGQLLILDLSRNNLSGSMPLSFGSLSSLLKLDLSNNVLQGKLPMELGNLKNLTLLDLGKNNFSGGLVESLEEMGSLKEMVISNNPKLGGDLRNIQWKYLRKLEILDLSNTGLAGEIPGAMAEMGKLRFLGLKSNNLSGNVPISLSFLPCISTLYLNGNNLAGEVGFSGGFYRKMGWRFGAWDNQNLCYNGDLISESYAPFGVKPCGERESSNHKGVKNEKISTTEVSDNSYFVESLGCSSCCRGGFWGIFLVQQITVIFLWDVLL
ncbi:piriformospora indica-insensitive protein 2-like [Morus notabilis]|uniref:piriformospora indica-insensitive protein 2-like n=1 Tax=Morus notabilis TaxID=981085 RepID=UPI000CED3ADE|nr:piriformospora indica-insensitive protein 2-like [Morus notabilis]